ncbi:MAG TPA: PAS domain S-box protein [Candidatus Binataceae bacterium]|nr:PAS domain S-box protein [Candidatus Binataceae bacterium]
MATSTSSNFEHQQSDQREAELRESEPDQHGGGAPGTVDLQVEEAPLLKRIWSGFAFAVVAMALAGIVTYVAVSRYTATSEDLAISHQVVENLQDLTLELTAADAATVGYALTGEERYLAVIPDLKAQALRDFGAVRQLTADRAEQARRLDQIEPILSAKLALIDKLAATHGQGAEAAAQIIRVGTGRDLMTDIRDRLNQVRGAEELLIAQREDRGRWFSHLIIIVILLGSAAALGAIAFAGSFIDRAMRILRASLADEAQNRAALAMLNETLEGRVNERSAVAETRAQELGRSQKESFAQSQLLQSVLDGMTEGVIVCDTHFRAMQFNPAAERMFGAANLKGQPLDHLTRAFEFLPEGGGKPITPSEWPLMRALRGHSSILTINLRTRGTAETRWIQVQARPLREAGGTVRAAMTVVRDITAQVGADRAQALLAAVIESTEDAIMSVNVAGDVSSWNRGAMALFGFTANEMIGTPALALVPEDRRAELEEVARLLAAGTGVHHFESVRLHKDGRRLEVALTISPIKAPDGQRLGYSSICRDIATRQLRQAALERAGALAAQDQQTRSAFLATMSHELRTPLSGIVGPAELLSETPLNDEQRDLVRTIASSSEMLASIIDDILIYSRLAAGKMAVEHLDFDLAATVAAVADGYAAAAAARQLELVLALAPAVAPAVATLTRGDPEHLRNVLGHLIDNAIKFTEAGEVVVEVTVAEVTADAPAGRLNFAVRDTGDGIALDLQPKLFAPFSQADGSLSRRYGGSGLGLAISALMVEGMGGQLGVVSNPGAGAAFTFALALEQHPRNEQRLLAAARALRGRRALVVDDNATSGRVICTHLCAWGMEAEYVAGGAAALVLMAERKAAGQPCEVVLADLLMPEMDGMTLARTLAADAQLKAARVIIMTTVGARDSEPAAEAFAAIVKPIKPAQLFERLCALLGPAADLAAVPPDVAAAADGIARPVVIATGAAAMARRVRSQILVIEDNPVNQKLALLQVRKIGYPCDAVSDAAAGLEAIGRTNYAAVLMDCEMSELDGFAATVEIRRRERNVTHLVVIAMTAYQVDDVRDQCFAAGMDDCVTKPVTLELLALTLDRWLLVEPPSEGAGSNVDLAAYELLPSLDQSVIEELRALSPEEDNDVVGELVDLFNRDLAGRIARMAQARVAADGETLARVCHSLKSAAGGMGLVRLGQLASDLEARARAGDFAAAGTLIGIIRSELTLVAPLLEQQRGARRLPATGATGDQT